MASAVKAKRRPSLGLVVFLGMFSVFLAALLSFANLASQSVQEVRVLPDAGKREPGLVYYVKGSTDPSPRWRAARNQLTREVAGAIRLSEADVNAWLGDSLNDRKSAKRGENTEPAMTLLGLPIHVSAVNFAVRDGQMQLAAYLEFPDLLPSRRFLYQVRGEVEVPPEGGLRFVPREGTVGRAPIVQIPVIGGFLHGRLMQLLGETPEFVEMRKHWSAIKEAEIQDHLLQLTLK